jgi:predicted Fe-S protein YdhL (DUF1289 family)
VHSPADKVDSRSDDSEPPFLINDEELNMKARYLILSAVLTTAPFHAFAQEGGTPPYPYQQRQEWWYSLSPEQQQQIVGTAVEKGQTAAQNANEAWHSLTPEQQQNIIDTHHSYATERRQRASSAYQSMTPEQKDALKTHRIDTATERSPYRQGRRESRRSYMGTE